MVLSQSFSIKHFNSKIVGGLVGGIGFLWPFAAQSSVLCASISIIFVVKGGTKYCYKLHVIPIFGGPFRDLSALARYLNSSFLV